MGHSKNVLYLLLNFWPIGKMLNWLGRQPPLSSILNPLFSQKSNHAVILPVNQDIQDVQSVALPIKLLLPLIDQSSDRVILDHCLCRHAEKCNDFPVEMGCLFLGEGCKDIHPSMGHPVDRSTAVAHAERAIQAGLVPMVIHSAFDAYVLGIPYRRMLAICFCCDCCCTVRLGLRLGPPAFWDAIERLPGLNFVVSQDCTGCGMCIDLCHIQAIQIFNNLATISDRCKGCGRCATACPVNAISLVLTDINVMSTYLHNRVNERTQIGSPDT
jgi:ferredoxin